MSWWIWLLIILGSILAIAGVVYLICMLVAFVQLFGFLGQLFIAMGESFKRRLD